MHGIVGSHAAALQPGAVGFEPGAAAFRSRRRGKVAIALACWALVSFGGARPEGRQAPQAAPAPMAVRAVAPLAFAAGKPAPAARSERAGIARVAVQPAAGLERFVPQVRVVLPAAPDPDSELGAAPPRSDEPEPVVVAAAPPSPVDIPMPLLALPAAPDPGPDREIARSRLDGPETMIAVAAPPAPSAVPMPPRRAALPATPYPDREREVATPRLNEPETVIAVAAPPTPVDVPVPLARVALPAAPNSVPEREVAPRRLPEPEPVVLVGAPPPPERPMPLAPQVPPAAEVAALRPVDVEQITQARERSPRVAQVDLPQTGDRDAPFAAKAQMAQLSLPRAVEQELALLQETAPSEVAVRLGNRSLGKVAVRVSQINTIDVQLAGLLDVMADRFAPHEFARLRDADSADSYVSLDQLRAAGISVRYDPIYDELIVSA